MPLSCKICNYLLIRNLGIGPGMLGILTAIYLPFPPFNNGINFLTNIFDFDANKSQLTHYFTNAIVIIKLL